jgi:hypothetical protein
MDEIDEINRKHLLRQKIDFLSRKLMDTIASDPDNINWDNIKDEGVTYSLKNFIELSIKYEYYELTELFKKELKRRETLKNKI